MERSKEVFPLWKNTGRGTFRLRYREKGGRRIIKPNETFRAAPWDIPQAFRDIITPLEPDMEAKEAKKIQETKPPEFIIENKGAAGWYNVVSAEGKVINENGLRKDAAETLKRQLEAGEE